MKIFTEEFKNYVREQLKMLLYSIVIGMVALAAITILGSVALLIDKIF